MTIPYNLVTITTGEFQGKTGKVIHYDAILKEYTIKIQVSATHIIWLWVPVHFTNKCIKP